MGWESASKSAKTCCFQPWPRYSQNGPQKAHFDDFCSLCPDLARIGPRRKSILNIFAALAQIWAECASEGIFRAFWQPWPRYGQNGSQKAYFEHLGNLGPDMARMGPRRSISSILATLAQIWPEWASGSIFWAFGPLAAQTSKFQGPLGAQTRLISRFMTQWRPNPLWNTRFIDQDA